MNLWSRAKALALKEGISTKEAKDRITKGLGESPDPPDILIRTVKAGRDLIKCCNEDVDFAIEVLKALK